MLKSILKNYVYALIILMVILGIKLWFEPNEALELIDTLRDVSFFIRLVILLMFNLFFSVSFILFDIWNFYRCKDIKGSE